jgi:hypothetical protein
MADLRAITVKNPWSWAIAFGGKNIENRPRPVSYRGPLAIHAGLGWSDLGAADPFVLNAWTAWLSGRDSTVQTPEHERDFWEPLDQLDPDDEREQQLMPRGAVVGVAELVDCHLDADCCRPWGMSEFEGKPMHHLVLANTRPLAEPIPCRGALGLWRPPAEVADQAVRTAEESEETR